MIGRLHEAWHLLPKQHADGIGVAISSATAIYIEPEHLTVHLAWLVSHLILLRGRGRDDVA